MKPISLMRSIFTVGGWTLLSRGAGFARDIMMAAYLGTGPVADAFNVAFSLPNMFRRFFAEGAFNMAFVPMFAKKLEGGEDAQGFARDAFNGLAAILIVFSVIGTFAMPWLVWAMASGFAGDQRCEIRVNIRREKWFGFGIVDVKEGNLLEFESIPRSAVSGHDRLAGLLSQILHDLFQTGELFRRDGSE